MKASPAGIIRVLLKGLAGQDIGFVVSVLLSHSPKSFTKFTICLRGGRTARRINSPAIAWRFRIYGKHLFGSNILVPKWALTELR